MAQNEKGTEHTAMKTKDLGEFVNREAGKVISGQEDILESILVSFLAGGHVLLEGVPGIAKTLMARTVSHILNLSFNRIQFTPDLMPSDITGTYVYDMRSSEFKLKKGPVFTEFLLADEINRTPPKTQSALLQAMEERQVTFDGVDHDLGNKFFVIATQNPVEYEGTYPLPEAQLDRFLLKALVNYPTLSEEHEVVKRSHMGFDPHSLDAVGLQKLGSPDEIDAAKIEILGVRVEDPVLEYAVSIVRRTREMHNILLGGSPRASLALIKCSKVVAALVGRDFVTPDDIKQIAPAVLRHRLILSPETLVEGVTPDQVIAGVLAAIQVPR
jgi:MoxR-like ATPase